MAEAKTIIPIDGVLDVCRENKVFKWGGLRDLNGSGISTTHLKWQNVPSRLLSQSHMLLIKLKQLRRKQYI